MATTAVAKLARSSSSVGRPIEGGARLEAGLEVARAPCSAAARSGERLAAVARTSPSTTPTRPLASRRRRRSHRRRRVHRRGGRRRRPRAAEVLRHLGSSAACSSPTSASSSRAGASGGGRGASRRSSRPARRAAARPCRARTALRGAGITFTMSCTVRVTTEVRGAVEPSLPLRCVVLCLAAAGFVAAATGSTTGAAKRATPRVPLGSGLSASKTCAWRGASSSTLWSGSWAWWPRGGRRRGGGGRRHGSRGGGAGVGAVGALLAAVHGDRVPPPRGRLLLAGARRRRCRGWRGGRRIDRRGTGTCSPVRGSVSFRSRRCPWGRLSPGGCFCPGRGRSRRAQAAGVGAGSGTDGI